MGEWLLLLFVTDRQAFSSRRLVEKNRSTWPKLGRHKRMACVKFKILQLLKESQSPDNATQRAVQQVCIQCN